MREECKCSGRVGVAINDDRYRRMMVVVVVLVVLMVVVKAIRREMCRDRGSAADIRLVRLRAGRQVWHERRHASGGIRD
jgi:hypothetical protein